MAGMRPTSSLTKAEYMLMRACTAETESTALVPMDTVMDKLGGRPAGSGEEDGGEGGSEGGGDRKSGRSKKSGEGARRGERGEEGGEEGGEAGGEVGGGEPALEPPSFFLEPPSIEPILPKKEVERGASSLLEARDELGEARVSTGGMSRPFWDEYTMPAGGKAAGGSAAATASAGVAGVAAAVEAV